MNTNNLKLKFYEAAMRDNQVVLGTNFLGFEEYVGLYRKSDWQNPILITKNKNGYFSIREILVDRYRDGSYIVFSKNSIPPFINRDVLAELQKIVSLAQQRQVSVSQFSAEIPLQEEELFRHAIQCLDDKLFDSFSREKRKNNQLNINDFSTAISSNSQNNSTNFQNNTTRFNSLQSVISKLLSDYYKEIDMSRALNPFRNFNPFSDEKVGKELRLYGFSLGSDEIKQVTLDMNKKIAEYLFKKLESNLIQKVRQDLVSKKVVLAFDIGTLKSYGISLPSVHAQKLLDKINHMIEWYYKLNRNEEISERNLQFAYGAIAAHYLNFIDQSEGINPFDTLKIPDEKEVEEIFRVNNALLTDEQVTQMTIRLSDTLMQYATKKLTSNLISRCIMEINSGKKAQQLDASVIMSCMKVDEQIAQRVASEVNFAVKQYMSDDDDLLTNGVTDAPSGYGGR